MAIVTIYSGLFCHAEAIADGVAKKLGYQRIDQEVYELAAKKYNQNIDKLKRAIQGTPGFFGRMTNEREKAFAYVKSAFAELLEKDGLLFHGVESHLIPPEATHLLKVCVIANIDYRVKVATETESISEHKALSKIHSADNKQKNLCRHLRHHDPYDESMYDILIAMQDTDVDSAIDMICDAAKSNALLVTPESAKFVKDFNLAAQVQLALVEKGYEVEVKAEHGKVHVGLNKFTNRLEQQLSKINELANSVQGVKSVTSGPGTRFTPPSLLRDAQFEMPSKVLLVDDEKEFVHTLSERLQNRNLDNAVVYDGEEALDFIKDDEPEVIILDLKMPGIDGIEVLRRVKKDYENIEVIILTGHGSEREEKIANELGAFAYLQKPVDINLLSKTMKEAYKKIENNKLE